MRKEMKDDCKYSAIPPNEPDGCTHPKGSGLCSGECDLFEKRYKFLKRCGPIDKSKCKNIGVFGKGTTGEQIVAGMIAAMQEEVDKEKVVEAKKKKVESEK